jgi:class I lanthipeptide synthase
LLAQTRRLLAKDVGRSTDASLATGLAGEAFALDRLGRHLDLDVRDALMARLARVVELCNAGAVGITFFSGVVGVAWALASMPTRLDAGDLEDLFATVDDLVGSQLDATPGAGCFELGIGDAGLAVYALRRLPRPAARHALARFIDRLEQTAEAAAGGLAWRAIDDTFVLGCAHGIAGVIGPLARTLRAGIAVDRCRWLLAGAVRFLLASCPPPPSAQPRFPFALAGGTPCRVDRFGWCSGDPGIADALLLAGATLHDPAIVEAARAIALAAARVAMPRTNDATTLCCGVAGRVTLFARLARELNEPALAAAAAHERTKLASAAAAGKDDGLFFGVAGTAFAQVADVNASQMAVGRGSPSRRSPSPQRRPW